jgi:hypothetical protein
VNAPAGNDPRMLAGIQLVQRVGAKTFQLRYSDDEEPVVWMAVAGHIVHDGKMASRGKVNTYTVGAALTPARAVQRLLDELVDGGRCAHCDRPTGVEHDFASTMPLSDHVCWYQYDPELELYRRSCEGDT